MTSINFISHWFDLTMGSNPQSPACETRAPPIRPPCLVHRWWITMWICYVLKMHDKMHSWKVTMKRTCSCHVIIIIIIIIIITIIIKPLTLMTAGAEQIILQLVFSISSILI